MTFNEKVVFLKSYKTAKENIRVYNKQIEDLRESQLPSGMHISDMPKHSSYDDQMASYGGEYWEIWHRMKEAEKQALRVIAAINQIAKIDATAHAILTERYIKGYKTGYICKLHGISYDTEWRHRREAIERIDI